jgi:hypothetical protein
MRDMDYRQQFKDYWARNLANLARMRAEQAEDARREKEVAAIASVPPTPESFDISNGIRFVNGQVVQQTPTPPSIAVARTAALTAANLHDRQKPRRNG